MFNVGLFCGNIGLFCTKIGLFCTGLFAEIRFYESDLYMFDMLNILNIESLTLQFRVTGWRRSIGCLKLQVIFCKRATNYRALLRKMTYKDKVSYDSTPPCRSKGPISPQK